MSENDLIQDIKKLRLNDDGTQGLSDEGFSKDRKTQLRHKLMNADTNDTELQALCQQLVDNPTQVLLFLKVLNDQSGSILGKLIRVDSGPRQSFVLSVLSAIRGILIKSSNVRDYYLTVYISLITKFGVTNPQHLNLFLTFVGAEKKVANAILVILAQDLKLNKAESMDIVSEYLQLQVDEEALNGTSLVNFVSTLAMCFPILPELCSKIYTNTATKQHILDAFSNQGKHTEYTVPILNCIAASSMVESCRTFTIQEYYSYLVDYLQSQHVSIRILAALCVVKLWTFIQVEQKSKVQVTELAKDLLLYVTEGDDLEYIEYSLEGLVYLSLFWKVRDLIRMDVSLIERFVHILQNYSTVDNVNTSIQYGILSILSNITKLKQPELNTAKANLKNVTAPQMESGNNEENQDNIKLFNRHLLEQDEIVSKLSAIKTYQSSNDNNFNEVISIIYHLSTDQAKSMRVELVKQGALIIIMNFLVNTSDMEKMGNRVVAIPVSKGDMTPKYRFKALRSLARMLICVDPRVSFQKYDVKSAIPFLVELIGPVPSDSVNPKQSYLQEMTQLDEYESLLALTNIAAADNSDTRRLLVSQILPFIDDLIVSKTDIQIASFELLNNLISEPLLLAKFFNIEQTANKQRLDILVKLLDSDNSKLQAVISGFLVNASNFDVIADVLVESKDIFDQLMGTIIEIMLHQVKESNLINPVTCLLVNLVYALANKDESLLKKLDEKLRPVCVNVLKNGTAESKEAITSVMSLLDF
ncbi:SHE4 [Candida margitis]|uniref:SHE4 n=1 Tax=Candida margitis TaxID=1775924 RepID=UPI002227AB84|nr:SHE4 [Candida margitis]KAI5954032.1 SHE4 [Candida margitis]